MPIANPRGGPQKPRAATRETGYTFAGVHVRKRDRRRSAMTSRQTHAGGMFGTPSECRHRETVYQQLCADILREARDLASLALATSRALAHPDVRNDGMLAGMVRSFVAVREAEVRSKLAEQHREEEKEA